LLTLQKVEGATLNFIGVSESEVPKFPGETWGAIGWVGFGVCGEIWTCADRCVRYVHTVLAHEFAYSFVSMVGIALLLVYV
jgi:hypothetical protein